MGLQAYRQSINFLSDSPALALSPGADKTGEYAHFASGDRSRDGELLSGIDPNAYDRKPGQFMPFYGADILANRDIRDERRRIS